MFPRLNRLFRTSRSWFGAAPKVASVRKHQFRPLLEQMGERLVPAAFYWTGANGSNDGSDAKNWSLLPAAQSTPAAAPVAGDALYFSNNYGAAGNNSNTSCQLTGANYGSINSTAAYSGTVSDTQTVAVTFSSGSSLLSGTINTGAATWTFTSVAGTNTANPASNFFGGPAAVADPGPGLISHLLAAPAPTVTFTGGGTVATTGKGTTFLNSVVTADTLNLGDVTDTFTSITFSAGATSAQTTVNAGTTLTSAAGGATYTGLSGGSTWNNPIVLNAQNGDGKVGTLSIVSDTTINTYIYDNGSVVVTGAHVLTMGGQVVANGLGQAIEGAGSVWMDSISIIKLGAVAGNANYIVLIAPSAQTTQQTGLFITQSAQGAGAGNIYGNVLIEGNANNQASISFKNTGDRLTVSGGLFLQQYSAVYVNVAFGPPIMGNQINCGSLTVSATGTSVNASYTGVEPNNVISNIPIINDSGARAGDFFTYNLSGGPGRQYFYQWQNNKLYINA